MAHKYLQVSQIKHVAEAALPMHTMQHWNDLVQVLYEIYLKQTLPNTSFAEQKLLVLSQITVLLLQELTYISENGRLNLHSST